MTEATLLEPGTAQAALANPGASAEAIQSHYDVSNDFYSLWLDDQTLAYSSALWDFTKPDDTLEAAQLRKLDYHIEQSQAARKKRVLDIGCGWGGTVRRLRNVHGVEHVTGLTLSEAQREFILEHSPTNVDVRLQSWSDHQPTAPYDAIISVGAFEHFARPGASHADKLAGYRAFFEKCYDWMQPGACLSLQTMSYGTTQAEDFSKYFETEIFPESDLPHLYEIALTSRPGFEITRVRDDREHYARTYEMWWRRLRANRKQAELIVPKAVIERFERYMQLMMIAFHTGRMGLLRLTLRRLDNPGAPLSV
jgi:cyclopropane-fatty-acyl-phospholipid synthase